MKRLTDRTSGAKTGPLTRALVVRLSSRPDTEDLAGPIEAGRRAYLAADDIWQGARAARIATTAELDYLDSVLDGAVFQLSRELLASVEGDRKAPTYYALFPQAARVAMAPTVGEAQALFVATLLSTLRAGERFAAFLSHADRIDAAQQALEGALSARKGLYIAEATTRATRNLALDALRRAYNLTYPRLQLRFPDSDALVASFFPRL